VVEGEADDVWGEVPDVAGAYHVQGPRAVFSVTIRLGGDGARRRWIETGTDHTGRSSWLYHGLFCIYSFGRCARCDEWRVSIAPSHVPVAGKGR